MADLPEEQSGDIPEWVVTFGDMMSLLLTFFVLLYSMSEIKEEQRQALLESLRQQFGHQASVFNPVPGRSVPLKSSLALLSSMGRARRADTLRGGDKVRAPVGDYPPLRVARVGKEATTSGVVYFEVGRTTLSREERQVLENVAALIRGKPQKIEIRGHTTTRPLAPGSPHRSHWDLAYARCSRVVDFLVEQGVDPKRLRIGLAAANEPIHVEADPALEKENARVEILMLDELTEELEGTPEEKKRRYSAATPARDAPTSSDP
jgi:chemotaxis protein MotB